MLFPSSPTVVRRQPNLLGTPSPAWGSANQCIAFLTLITIPLTFSIANQLGFGFTSYALLEIIRGEVRGTHWLFYVLAALFIARFIYLNAG